MGILDSIQRRASPENPSTSLADPNSWMFDAWGATATAAGQRVSPRTACRLSTVLACVRILSESVAQLPLLVYERIQPQGKDRAPEHPLWGVLHEAPNLLQTSFEFREMLQAHLLLWGNAYAEIEREGGRKDGRVVALWPIVPDLVHAVRQDDAGRPYYLIKEGAKFERFEQQEILHIRAMSLGGLQGLSIATQIRDAIGLGMAAEDFGARYFSNGLHPGGILVSDGNLSAESLDRIRVEKESILGGGGTRNAHRLAILTGGVKWQQIATDPEQAQSLETRLFQVRDIARAFRIPLHMVQDLEKGASNASVEAQQVEFLVQSLMPWLVRWEQVLNRSLLRSFDRPKYLVEFFVSGFARGDMETRWKAYSTAVQMGAMTRNEVRSAENMNPLPGLDEPLTPLNMGVLGSDGVTPADAVAKGPAPQRDLLAFVAHRAAIEQAEQKGEREERAAREKRAVSGRLRLQRAFEGLFARAAERFVGREVKAVLRALKRSLSSGAPIADLQAALAEFYDAEFPAAVRMDMLPLILSLAGAIRGEVADEVGGDPEMHPHLGKMAGEYVDTFIDRHAGSSQGQVVALASASPTFDDAAAAIEQRLAEWQDKRPAKIGSRESVQAGGFLAREAYALAGVTRLRWHAVGTEDCPLCSRLDGTVVGIRAQFLESGDELQADGAQPLVAQTPISHPPLHRGCNCVIVADG